MNDLSLSAGDLWALVYMLQVILIHRLIHFQTRSVCFNLGQLVSTQVSLGQVQNTGHKSLFYQYRNNPNRLQVLTLGLRLALMNVEDTFCIGKTMTCDLCFVPAPN